MVVVWGPVSYTHLVVVAYLGGGDVEKEKVAKMLAAGISAFPTPERAMRAIGALLRTK